MDADERYFEMVRSGSSGATVHIFPGESLDRVHDLVSEETLANFGGRAIEALRRTDLHGEALARDHPDDDPTIGARIFEALRRFDAMVEDGSI